MPPKKRGQKVDVSQYFAAEDASLKWAEDTAEEIQRREDAEKAKIAEAEQATEMRRRGIQSVQAAQFGDFRNEARMTIGGVPEDMEAPFTAIILNFGASTKEEDIKNAVISQNPQTDILGFMLVSRDKTRFALVEFATREQLGNAMLLTGLKIKSQYGIKVDIARPEQAAKLTDARAPRIKSGLGGSDFSRDDMGQQPEGSMRGGRGSRGGAGSPNTPFGGEFSRDAMGEAKQPDHVIMPSSGGSSRPQFPSAFSRDDMGTAEVTPLAPGATGGQRRGGGGRFGGGGGGGGGGFSRGFSRDDMGTEGAAEGSGAAAGSEGAETSGRWSRQQSNTTPGTGGGSRFPARASTGDFSRDAMFGSAPPAEPAAAAAAAAGAAPAARSAPSKVATRPKPVATGDVGPNWRD